MHSNYFFVVVVVILVGIFVGVVMYVQLVLIICTPGLFEVMSSYGSNINICVCVAVCVCVCVCLSLSLIRLVFD